MSIGTMGRNVDVELMLENSLRGGHRPDYNSKACCCQELIVAYVRHPLEAVKGGSLCRVPDTG
jgi:hypothetical protein